MELKTMELKHGEYVSLGDLFRDTPDFNRNWWCARYASGLRTFHAAYVDSREVARAEMDDRPCLDDYLGETTSRDWLEIQFIEVATTAQRRGVGQAFVALLAAHYTDRRLTALSEGADDFWASLGWVRIDHSEGPRWRRPLFVASM